MLAAFEIWLRARGYNERVIGNGVSRVRRVAAAYGGLAALGSPREIAVVESELAYSVEDQRDGRPNPSKIIIGGDFRTGLASLKNAVSLYREFMSTDIVALAPTMEPRSARRLRSAKSEPVNGADLLAQVTREMGLNLSEFVARCAIWAHPRVFAELARIDPHAAWYPGVRRKQVGEERGALLDGVRLDDNSKANQAIKLAALGIRKATQLHACHVWPRSCYDARYHTAIGNLVLVPAPIASLTDHDRSVAASLRRRAFELYAWRPEGEAEPERHEDYPAPDVWRAIPEPGDAIEAVLRRRVRVSQPVLARTPE